MDWHKIGRWIAMVLSFIGGLAWGIAGVTGLFGSRTFLVDSIITTPILANIIYILVGVSAIYLLVYGKKK